MERFESDFRFYKDDFLVSKDFVLDFKELKVLVVATRGTIQRGYLSKFKSVFNLSNEDICCELEELPTAEGVVDFLRGYQGNPDAIVAIGGGSSLDFAKILTWALPIWRRYKIKESELIGLASVAKENIPLFVVPTTVGTGSEVTPYATLWDLKSKMKLSSQTSLQVPTGTGYCLSFYSSLPESVALNSVLDSLTQLLESIWNRNFSEDILPYSARGISLIFNTLNDIKGGAFYLKDPFRTRNLVEAAYLSGLCIAKTRTSICHSISYPLTVNFGVPHGLGCFVFLPKILDLVIESRSVAFDSLLIELGMSSNEFRNTIHKFYNELRVEERFGEYCHKDDLIGIVDQMFTPGRSDTFIVDLSPELLRQILF